MWLNGGNSGVRSGLGSDATVVRCVSLGKFLTYLNLHKLELIQSCPPLGWLCGLELRKLTEKHSTYCLAIH